MYCLYASPLMLLLLAVVDCSVNKENFDMGAALADKVCPVDRRVFERKAVSLISCVNVAFRTDGCAGVSYNEEQKMCYGCDTDDPGEFQSLPGTVFYSPPKVCPGVFQNISGYMLMVDTEQTWTYDEAKSACAVCSASLVRIDSLEEQAAIQAHLNELGGQGYWIQLTKDLVDVYWKFDDWAQAPMTSDYWAPNMPFDFGDYNCGFMSHTYGYSWLNTDCTFDIGYICEIQ